MPEASIHKHDQSLFPEDKIWGSRQGLVAPPPYDPGGAEYFHHFHFRGLIFPATYPPHPLRSLSGCQKVSHGHCLTVMEFCRRIWAVDSTIVKSSLARSATLIIIS